MKLGTIEMPLTLGVLKMLTGMAMCAGGDEHDVVLCDLQVAVGTRHGSDYKSIVANGRAVVRLDRKRRGQRNYRVGCGVRCAQH